MGVLCLAGLTTRPSSHPPKESRDLVICQAQPFQTMQTTARARYRTMVSPIPMDKCAFHAPPDILMLVNFGSAHIGGGEQEHTMIYSDKKPEGGSSLAVFAILFAMMTIVLTLALMRHPDSHARVWVPATPQRSQSDLQTRASMLDQAAHNLERTIV